jgi:hypothetical protein
MKVRKQCASWAAGNYREQLLGMSCRSEPESGYGRPPVLLQLLKSVWCQEPELLQGQMHAKMSVGLQNTTPLYVELHDAKSS